MDISRIKETLKRFKDEGKSVFATSSFQSQSIPLLHIISTIDNSIPIYFTNTGFLFPETLAFKDELAIRFDLNIIELFSETPKIHQMDENGHLLFASDPDYCCYLNKISPLEPVLMEYDVWINGVRADQNANRKEMKEFQEASFSTLRYHPILQWKSRDVYQYIADHKLPTHPMEKKGYLSIGCEPCTRKFTDGGNERNARWFGMNKTECGLHTDLAKPSLSKAKR
jgi:phosphoadenosine phosphosulfate reductase